MNARVKNFLERNIDYLEEDLVKFFLILYGDPDMWYLSETSQVFKILDELGIEYDTAREQAVYKILLTETEAFGRSKDPGLWSMPVKEFVEIMLDNHLNLSIEWWAEYLISHRALFPDVNVFKESDMWAISRKD